ncbi:MAG TPA: YncE family protein [Thermoanaerobaculia bacterium]|nr:YncE family protein [Thermoanaerobaculia bacterium]
MRSLVALFLFLAGCAHSATMPSAASAPSQKLLLVVNQGSQTMSFVDPVAMTVLSSIPMAPAPHEIAVSEDGKTAYVALYGNREVVGEQIAVIDVASRAEVKRLSLAGHKRPHGLVVRGSQLFATSEMSKEVLRLDRASGAIDWTGATGAAGSHMIAVTADAKRVYSGNIGSDSVSVIDVVEGETPKQITVGKGPEGIALSPDGSEVWAAHRGGGGVSVIDTKSEKVVATLLPEVVSARVAFTPDGTKVLLFDMPSGNLIVIDRAARKELGRIALPGMPGGGIVAGDSRTAYVSVYEPFSVTRIDLQAMKITGSVETGIAPDGMVLVE